MRRSKFRLLASFLEATMLSVHDSPIEFEVSIGMQTFHYIELDITNDYGYVLPCLPMTC
jgi:hypothetical protein